MNLSPVPLKVVFMGSPDFATPTLRALMGSPSFDLVAVVTQPDRPKGRGRKTSPSPVKKVALDAGLEILDPERARDKATVDRLREIDPDYLVVVAYGQILSKEILDIPRLAPVNLHASLLPRWRGAAPIHRAFIEGDNNTGVCVMLMEQWLDTGAVLSVADTTIADDDTIETVHDRLADIGAGLMVDTLVQFAAGEIEPQPQDDSQTTYAKKLCRDDFVIDWTATAKQVSRKIRGLSPFPGAVTQLQERSLKLLFAKAATGSGRPGEVLAVLSEGIVVACGSDAVLVTELKPNGKKNMSAHAYTLGHSLTPGLIFG